MERFKISRRDLVISGVGFLPGLIIVACYEMSKHQSQAEPEPPTRTPAKFAPQREEVPELSIPTAVVKDSQASALKVTDFSFVRVSPGELGIKLCTEGRPVGTTLRVSVYERTIPSDRNIDPDALDKNGWRIIKELGVPCFDTNPANPDKPVWRNQSGLGRYLFRGEARPSEAQGNWNHPSVKVVYASFVLQNP